MFTKLAIIAVVTVAISAAPIDNDAACAFPDGTDQKFYWDDCSAAIGLSSPQLLTTGAQGLTSSGAIDYPLDIKKAVVIATNVTNNGAPLSEFYVDASIYLWKKPLFGGACAWEHVVTLGLLNNLNGCQIEQCPLGTGAVSSKTTFDFSQYGAVINLIPTSYAVKIQLKTKAVKGGSSYIGCVEVEGKVDKQ